MEAITKNPGLQHISEDIFKLLDTKTLVSCRSVNSSWKNVLNQPMFWLKKLNSQDMPLDVQRSWKTLVEELDDDQVANELVLIMTKVYSNGKKIQKTFDVIVKLAEADIHQDLMKFMLENENPRSEMDGILWIRSGSYPLMKNVKPIHLAACFGLTGAIEKLTRDKTCNPIIKDTFF